VCEDVAKAVGLYKRAASAGIPGVPRLIFAMMTKEALIRTAAPQSVDGDVEPICDGSPIGRLKSDGF
jgi:hypothetical protein